MKIEFDCPGNLHEILKNHCELEKISIDEYICGLLGDNLLISSDDLFNNDPVYCSLTLADSTKYDIKQSFIDELSKTYDKEFIKHEFNRMVVWIDSNPRKRKTRRGINRFIITWLNRNDTGGATGECRKQLESSVAALEAI